MKSESSPTHSVNRRANSSLRPATPLAFSIATVQMSPRKPNASVLPSGDNSASVMPVLNFSRRRVVCFSSALTTSLIFVASFAPLFSK